MKKSYFKSLLIVFVCAFCGLVARAAVPIFSQYGQIQNVQNYSTNPFWSPNAPYNQRLPQPVYVQGADLNADDCIKVVQSLVAAQCMARDNCKNTDLTEIRPTIMVQLSNLPGANYVSACSGYLDGVFESYVQQYGNTLPNRPTAFPSATVPNPDLNDSGGIKFENPYKQQPTKWQMEIRERSEELQSLQNENGADNYNVSATDFPTTYADLSFYERMENERAGLEPYKDLLAYKTINAKTEAEWCSDSSHYNSGECAEYKAKQENSTNKTSSSAKKKDNCSQYAKGSEAYKCCTYTDNDGADWVNGQCVCRRRSLCGTRLHWNGNGCLPSEEALKKVGEKHACENTDVAKWYEQGDVCRCDCPAGQHWVFDESKAVDYELGLLTNDPQTGQRKSWDYALWKPLIENPGKCVSDDSK